LREKSIEQSKDDGSSGGPQQANVINLEINAAPQKIEEATNNRKRLPIKLNPPQLAVDPKTLKRKKQSIKEQYKYHPIEMSNTQAFDATKTIGEFLANAKTVSALHLEAKDGPLASAPSADRSDRGQVMENGLKAFYLAMEGYAGDHPEETLNFVQLKQKVITLGNTRRGAQGELLSARNATKASPFSLHDHFNPHQSQSLSRLQVRTQKKPPPSKVSQHDSQFDSKILVPNQYRTKTRVEKDDAQAALENEFLQMVIHQNPTQYIPKTSFKQRPTQRSPLAAGRSKDSEEQDAPAPIQFTGNLKSTITAKASKNDSPHHNTHHTVAKRQQLKRKDKQKLEVNLSHDPSQRARHLPL